MKTFRSVMLFTALFSASVWAAPPQRFAPPPSPAASRSAPPNPPSALGNGRQISPSTDNAPGDQSHTCKEVRGRKFSIYFEKVDIEKLVQTVADATCKAFILPENIRGKISIVGPENGRLDVSAAEFYTVFLAALDANGLTVVPRGRFLKVVDKRSAKQNTIPTFTDSETDFTTNEQMVTKVFKIHYSEIEPLRGVLQQLVTKDGDVISYPPDTLIVNDLGSNLHRLQALIDQLDAKSSNDEIRTIQLHYASAQDAANMLQKLFEAKGKNTRPVGSVAPGIPQVQGGESSGGPVTLSQLIPDERTNKLIVVASPAGFERIQRLINEIDVPISGAGRINVYYLENANAEEIASTLQNLAQGSANRPRSSNANAMAGAMPVPGGNATPGATGATELFGGEVKISPDKATNSLVIVASQNDYRNLLRVIEKLDIRRRQVFVEAVIMEVNLDRTSEFGVQFHQGFTLPSSQGAIPGIVGTNYTKSATGPPSLSLTNLIGLGGLLAGIQGPAIPALTKLGINIPSFGVVLHALQTSSDVNVLSTPHLLTSDNEEAQITVGQNVPFQAGYSPTGFNSLLGGLNGTTGTTGTPAASPLSLPLGGFGSLIAPINRQNVELKLSIKPQINESDYIRLVINESTEEIASSDPVLGPTTSKRSAKTTVVARNQETVVIGGIMQDRTIQTVNKIPILGDIPVLGQFFRDQTVHKVKTNLLLFLTPYIIKDPSDFRAIFERKMLERQQFVEQFYGQVPGYEVAVDFSRKAGPVGRMTQVLQREQSKAENGGPGLAGERLIQPGAAAPAPASPPPNAAPAPSGEPSPPPMPGNESAAPPVQEDSPTPSHGQ